MTAVGGPSAGAIPALSPTPCRPATATEFPGSSSTLVKSATAAGWTVAATYAAGWATSEDEESAKLSHSTVVRLAHPDGRRAVAVWTNGSPDFGAFALRGWPRWTPCGVSTVAALVRAPKRPKRYVPADPFELDGPQDDEDAP